MSRALIPPQVAESVGAAPTTTALVPAPAAKTSAVQAVAEDVWEGLPPVLNKSPWDIGGGVAGALLVRKHPFLGFLGGAALGRNLPNLVGGTTAEREAAGLDIGAHGAGIAGSLLWRKRHPVLGYLLGYLVGAGAGAAVPGSTARDRFSRAIDRMRGK